MLAASITVLLIGSIDWHRRQIPNHLLSILLIAAAFTAAASAQFDIKTIALNVVIGLALALPGYIKGVVGGGDVKLMLAISPLWPTSQLLVIFVSGVLSTVCLMKLLEQYSQAIQIAGEFQGEQANNFFQTQNLTERGIPWGTAIAVGMCLYALGSTLLNNL